VPLLVDEAGLAYSLAYPCHEQGRMHGILADNICLGRHSLDVSRNKDRPACFHTEYEEQPLLIPY